MTIRLRALERDDLGFVHALNNDSRIMSYWFTEPYEALVELRDIYDRHVHDNRERRFVIEAVLPRRRPHRCWCRRARAPAPAAAR